MPRNVKPFELVQLLLMENRSKDKFLEPVLKGLK